MMNWVYLFLLVATAKAAEVVYEWDLQAIVRNDMSPDCMNIKNARRGLFLVGQGGESEFPGPLVEANEGDTIRVRTEYCLVVIVSYTASYPRSV